MTIEEMKQKKQEKGYTYSQLASFTGVPVGTLQKLFSGETKSPRYDTLAALNRFFEKGTQKDGYVREASVYMPELPPKKQGEYTIEDYYALPDEKRVELIDGVIYDMAAPRIVHQRIMGEIHRQIANFILAQHGSCVPMMAPVDVRLDCDDKTMVQPDVLVLCDLEKLQDWGIMGAPDFVLEVLSPSTKRKDCIKKLQKYCDAGVKEYWILDPDKQCLLVYQFDAELYPVIYGLDSSVTLSLFDGKLSVDLSIISDFF